MYAFSNYVIKIQNADNQIEEMAKVLSDAYKAEDHFKFNKRKFIQEEGVFIEHTETVVLLEDITELAKKLAKTAPLASFVIKGIIDTSSSAGEYMNFIITYKQGLLEEHSSDWYRYAYLEDLDYEEFCEQFEDEYSEEEFEDMQADEYEWFIVETTKGDKLLKMVPIDHVRKITIES